MDYKADAPHQLLQSLVGEWSGPTQTWADPSGIPSESTWRGSIRSVLGGRFVIHEYEGSMGGKPHQGQMVFGYDRDRFTMAWIDSFHMGNGIMMAEGPVGEGGRLAVLGSYDGGGERWGWRTELSQGAGADDLVLLAFNITPSGKEMKAIETHYRRGT